MILGAPDVVPHQDMTNPAPPDDPDSHAYGDLPYACDGPYSRDIATFKGPTRVVGRLPDLTGGARDPSHLIALLAVAENYQSRNATDYGKGFGLSTQSWRKSTKESLFNIFGEGSALALSPPSKHSHSASRLAPLAHFINCHGAQSDPKFYGENGSARPIISLTSDVIKGKIKPGTVAAVECCYGAELYDENLSLPLPISQRYLRQGAYGYFGSSTISYGPAEGNGAADLITQYFLRAIIREGASLGRAALLARQWFARQTAELDPIDLKTLGQFNLLGDPSLNPVVTTSPTTFPKGAHADENCRLERRGRRAKMRADGELLQETKPTASRKATEVRKSAQVEKALANIARKAGIGTRKAFTAFDVKVPKRARARGSKAATVASRYYVAVYRPKKGPRGALARSVAAVAKEVSGRIVGYRIYKEK